MHRDFREHKGSTIEGEGSFFGVNSTPFYMSYYTFLALGGTLDNGSSPSVIDACS